MVRKILVLLGSVAIAGAAFYVYERPQTTTVPFAELPVTKLRYEGPIAPQGFPDCTTEMVDVNRGRNASVTLRPKPGVQCGVPWTPEAWWIDANGVRHDPKPAKVDLVGRLLLMGSAGAQGGGGVESSCGLEPPLTYYMDLGGETVEVGTVEKPQCYGGRKRFYPSFMSHRLSGLESPPGWFDATIEDLTAGDASVSFTFVLRNDTPQTVMISLCPFVDVQFVPAGTEPARERGYRTWLNCPAGPDGLEPGDVVRFELQAPIPGATGSGYIEVEYRDERRVMDRVVSETFEVPA